MIRILPQNIFSSFLVSLLFFVISSRYVSSAQAASLYLSPASGSYFGNFDVTINVDPQGASVSGVDTLLKYDPAKLEAQIIQNGVFEQYLMKNIDKTTGSIVVRAYNTSTLVTSTASVAKVTFKPLATTGSTNITILYTPSQTDDSNVASGGADILSAVSGSVITLQTTTPAPEGNTGVGATNPTTAPKTPVVPKTGDPVSALAFSSVSLGFIASGLHLLKSKSRPK
jgi:hypothetical protein